MPRGRTKAEVINYNMLKRYSLSYLLWIMRAKPGSPLYDKEKKFKAALEVCSKDIGKQVVDLSQHQHYNFFRSLLERGEKRIAVRTGSQAREGV